MTQLPPPGWYADPVEPERQRYWDGAGWSDDGYAEAMAAAQAQRAARAAAPGASEDGAAGARTSTGEVPSQPTAPQAGPSQMSQPPRPGQPTSPGQSASPSEGPPTGQAEDGSARAPEQPGDPQGLLRPPPVNRAYGAPADSPQVPSGPGAPPTDPYAAPGQPPYGQQGQPPSGPPPAGQSGQPPYGQPPYGAPQPYGRPPSRQRPGLRLRVGDTEELLAAWWQRALAWLLDLVIVSIVGLAVTLPFFSTYLHALAKAVKANQASGDAFGQQPPMTDRESLILSIVIFVLFAVYRAVQHRLWGRTIGKRALRLHVIGADGKRPTWGQSAARQVLADVPLIIPAFGYFWLLADSGLAPSLDRTRRQALHDRAAGTVVVRR